MQQRFTAREGHSSSRLLEKDVVLSDLFHERLWGDGVAHRSVVNESAVAQFAVLWHQLWLKVLAFGVVAPSAAQRTPFQKDGGAYAWPVVYGISFDVEYQSLHDDKNMLQNYKQFGQNTNIQSVFLQKRIASVYSGYNLLGSLRSKL